MKDISLMKMNGHKGFKLGALNFAELLSCHLNKSVKDLLEVVICCLHDLPICPGTSKGITCTHSPDHLQAQQANLHKNSKMPFEHT